MRWHLLPSGLSAAASPTSLDCHPSCRFPYDSANLSIVFRTLPASSNLPRSSASSCTLLDHVLNTRPLPGDSIARLHSAVLMPRLQRKVVSGVLIDFVDQHLQERGKILLAPCAGNPNPSVPSFLHNRSPCAGEPIGREAFDPCEELRSDRTTFNQSSVVFTLPDSNSWPSCSS